MGLFGIGDDSRMMLDVPVNLAPRLGLPKGQNKVNIVIPNNKDPEAVAIGVLMDYGVAYQNARNFVGAGSKKKPYKILTDSSDPGWKDFRLDDPLHLGSGKFGEERTPESVAEMRGRTGAPSPVDDRFLVRFLGQKKG